MKKVVSIMLVLAVLLLPLVVFADECLEGDCENGRGKGFTEEGQLYDGEWQDGEPHGQGRLFVAKGKVLEGRWQHGVLLEEREDKKVFQRK
ncbi:MAG: hypothetical protein ABFS18_07385 [Thermodesulfobacteriota bacterium]